MGYETWFNGELDIKPPLTPDETKQVNTYAAKRFQPKDSPTGIEVLDQDSLPLPFNGYSYWCPWAVSDDGHRLIPEDGKAYDFEAWLQHLIETQIKPRGRNVSGLIQWQGEDSDDRGRIEVKDNNIKLYTGVTQWVEVET